MRKKSLKTLTELAENLIGRAEIIMENMEAENRNARSAAQMRELHKTVLNNMRKAAPKHIIDDFRDLKVTGNIKADYISLTIALHLAERDGHTYNRP